MASARPIPRDYLPSDGLPVFAARGAPADRSAPRSAPVTHDYAAVLFLTGGRSRVELNGEWKLSEGDALLVPAGQAHRMLEMQRSEYWGLGFRASCFVAEGTAALFEPLERVREGASAVVQVPAARHGFLDGLFQELQRLSDERGAPSEALYAVRKSLLTLILAEIERAAAPMEPSGAGGGVVAQALRYIERHCLRRLTPADVAAAVGRSPAYVTTALTQATGRSAGDWIVSGRMAEARRLLLYSDEMVDVIAERVGYADATHFIRMFRRAHGATPAAWRAARMHASK